MDIFIGLVCEVITTKIVARRYCFTVILFGKLFFVKCNFNIGGCMKKCKHYLLFLLAGSLLLLPVTSHYAYAISWDDIKKNISSFFSENTLQKIVPGALMAFGVAGALYYWWKSRKGGDDSGKGGENLIPKELVSTSVTLKSPKTTVSAPTIQQFQVYSQFNRDGGGPASCGYQTLLRGMQVVSAKSQNESDASIEKTLMDSIPIQVYFGPDGEWRKQIIARRKEQEFKKALDKKFISVLAQNCDDKVIALYGSQAYEPIIAAIASKKLSGDKARDLYKSSFGFLEDIMLLILKQPEVYMQYDFTDEAIQNDLAKSLEQLKNESTEALIKILQKPEMINQCFDLEKMRAEFLSKDFVLSLPQLVQELNDDPNLREDFAGEWLSDGEVEYLWNQDRSDIVPLRVNCGFKAIANFELVDNPDIPKEFDEVAVYVDENVKPSLNKKQQMFQIFGLGTMRQTGEASGTRGHWYPLVMYQSQNGERSYYIMDSASNNDRTHDENAWKIINVIEKAAK
jgi:hypothetical protein